MVRNAFRAAAFATALALTAGSLAGCNTTSGLPTVDTSTVNANLAAIIAEVNVLTQAACGFVPLASTIASIVAAGNPGVVTAGAIAGAVCGAVKVASLRRGVTRFSLGTDVVVGFVTVGGVKIPVEGKFVAH